MSGTVLFRSVLELVRVGNKIEARRLVAEELDRNPENADAWVVMAQLVEDRERALYYIRRALDLRPNDARARQTLEKLLFKSMAKRGVPHQSAPWLKPAPQRELEDDDDTAEIAAQVAMPTPQRLDAPLPSSRRRRARLVPMLAIIIGVIMIGLGGGALCGMILPGLGAEPVAAGSGETYQVMYRVTSANTLGGFNEARVTYRDQHGRLIKEEINVRSWTRTMHLTPGERVTITVEDLGVNGSVTCEIVVNGEVWQRSQMEGRGASATCGGAVGRN